MVEPMTIQERIAARDQVEDSPLSDTGAVDLVKTLLLNRDSGGEGAALDLAMGRALAVPGDAVCELALVLVSTLRAWSDEVRADPLSLLESVLEKDDSYENADANGRDSQASNVKARVGSALVLTGVDGQTVEVTLVRMVDAAPPRFDASCCGGRILAIQLRLKNVGSVVYDDCPGSGLELLDNLGQQFAPTYCEIAAGPLMPTVLRLFPGDTRLGYMTWNLLPADTRPTQLQMTLDAGTGPETGIWSLASNA